MKSKSLCILVILSVFLRVTSNLLACLNPPEAYIDYIGLQAGIGGGSYPAYVDSNGEYYVAKGQELLFDFEAMDFDYYEQLEYEIYYNYVDQTSTPDDWSDNPEASSFNVSTNHTYSNEGTYTVKFVVTDNSGYNLSGSCSVKVHVLPKKVHNETRDIWHLFIQRAIDASNNDNVLVANEGVYVENIDFKGKDITLKSTAPDDSGVVKRTVIVGNGIDSTVSFVGTEPSTTKLEGFTITSGWSDQGLVGHWELDEASGSSVSDSSGNGINGTAYGNQSWQPSGGHIRGALAFNGTDDYVNLGNGNNNEFDFSEGFTVSAWVKTNAFGSTRMIVAKDDEGVGGLPGRSWNLYHHYSDNKIHFEVFDADNHATPVVGSTELETGRWYHYVATYQYVTNGTCAIKLYVDGVLDNTVSLADGPVQNTDSPVNIGRRSYPDVENRFNGMIDDVRIYDRALADSEIAYMFTQETMKPIAYWSLDDKADNNLVSEGQSDNYAGNASANTDTFSEAGVIGRCLNFGGTELVTVADDDVFSFGDGTTDSPFSISAWIYVSGTGTHQIIGKNMSDVNGEWLLRIAYGNLFFICIDDDADSYIFAKSTPLTAGWHHVAATYDGSGVQDGINIYVDKSLAVYNKNSYGTYTAMDSGGGYPVAIGGRNDVWHLYNDKLDDIAIYNKELSAGDVAEIFGGGLASIAHWAFDNDGTDVSWNANDVTLQPEGTHQLISGTDYHIGTGSLELAGDPEDDGLGDYVIANDIIDDVAGKSFTLMTWVKSGLSTGQEIFAAFNTSTGGNRLLIGQSANNANLMLYDPFGGYYKYTNKLVFDNQWHHVVYMLDTINQKAYVYVDGDMENIYSYETSCSVVSGVSPDTFYIGQEFDGSNYTDHFAGHIDDMRIFSRRLAPIEIKNIYEKGKPWFNGGGIFSDIDPGDSSGTSATISKCVITGNKAQKGGGIYNCDGTILNCTITANTADSEGGGLAKCDGTIVNCVVAGNTATNGGGLDSCKANIISCTIADNTATNECGGIRIEAGESPAITNCIVWGNTGEASVVLDQIYGGNPTVTYSCIQDGTPDGTPYYSTGNNIDYEPLFEASGDYHITSSSPCLDAGNVGGSVDIEGNPRPFDFPGIDNNDTIDEYDIGAYEFTDVTPPEKPEVTWVVAPTADPDAKNITMTASSVSDDNNGPVEYYFEYADDDTINSGWVSGPSYTFTEAQLGDTTTHYTFIVKARDQFGNVTSWFTEPENVTANDVASFVDVEFFVKDAGNGQVEISYMTFNDVKLRSIALEVTLTNAAITNNPDIISIIKGINSVFNCFMDNNSAAVHPLAKSGAAGEPDFSGGTESHFVINMAYYNQANNTDYVAASSTAQISLIKLQLTGTTGQATIAVDKDTFRGSTFVNRDMKTNLPVNTSVIMP